MEPGDLERLEALQMGAYGSKPTAYVSIYVGDLLWLVQLAARTLKDAQLKQRLDGWRLAELTEQM